FEAIASDSGHLPRPDFELPLAEAQVAKVISNADPENQGRVQVRFDWQLHDTTDWIRVMTPDAGSSGKVSKNRGFMAIPEVGDQVMIGFQHNHPIDHS
ncbi:phage baseplate assembly protein V, partial [Bergeyella zoohelcum]|uniref:phage baseplate assembly protein V n=1 Tax=Bergeyella zoohelcum TaxID=1015 RepID=UPI00288912FC